MSQAEDRNARPQRRIGQALFGVLFARRRASILISGVLLVLIAGLPQTGVLLGFAFMLAALLLCARHGAFGDIGFRRPRHWPRTLALGVGLGLALQLVFSVLVDPLLARLAGTPVDLSSLDGIRGQLPGYLVMLAVGWVVGGFLEEMLFRGYLVERIRRVMAGRRSAAAVAVLLPALAFGLAHSYQGVAGMISTGLVGLILGALFIRAGGNLWLPILVHGVSNTIGITLIFTNADRLLGTLLFH